MIGTQPAVLVRETHSGFVLLVGKHACKVKKSVDLGFLDFRDMTARRAACLREIELNRRLSPDVYPAASETGPKPARTSC